jgi:SET domain-containing protein
MNVYSKESNIPNVGKGLFAARDIEKDECIVEYLGDLLQPDQEPRSQRSNVYFNDGTILCCHDDDLASYANDCIKVPTEARKLLASLRKYKPFYEKHPNTQVNAEIHLEEEQHKAFIYSRTLIKKDEEIFCHYGFPYWFNHEAINVGFELEKEIERNGFPDDLFRYAGFHAYIKEFYPQSKEIDVTEVERGFVIAIKFENDKGIILQMPRLSKCFEKSERLEM